MAVSVNPRKGCDPDILDALDDLGGEVKGASARLVIQQAQGEIINLRAQLALTKHVMALPVQRHGDACECAECWQAMEAGGGKG